MEARLLGIDDLPEIDDFAEILALYEPTDSPSPPLVGFKGLRSAAPDCLHDLGCHDCCFHDVALREIPDRT